MNLTADFTLPEFEDESNADFDYVMQGLISKYINACDSFVEMARNKSKEEGGFGNVTGNLRSSIGGIVVYEGEVLHANFEQSDLGSTDGSHGYEEAMNYAEELRQQNTEGLALIVVAGENYAFAVETKGLDVITGSGLETEAELKASLHVAA